MSLKYLWEANFNGKTISQPANDRYSKHDDNAEWNPSSFRDFQDYFSDHQNDLESFRLGEYIVIMGDRPVIRCGHKVLHEQNLPLTNVRPIYYRRVESQIVNGVMTEPEVVYYVIGYQGTDADGNNVQKTVTVL